MRSQHITYRPDIDGLRAFAITLVLLYHLWPERLSGGFVGVDVFFVISGFLITQLLMKRLKQGDLGIRAFYSARINRLFPALLTVTAITLAYGGFALVPSDLARLGKHLLSTFAFIENWTLHKESGYFDAELKVKPLAHMWSLSIEEQFYLLFPLILLWIQKRSLSAERVIALLFLSSFIACAIEVYRSPSAAYLMPWMRAWELLSGSLIAYQPGWLALLRRPRVATGASWLGAALIAVSAAVLDGSSRFPGLSALPTVLGTCLIIGAGREALLNQGLLSSRLMIGVGLVSYPLYLWHWVLIALLHLDLGSEVSDQALAMTGGASFLLAILTYLGVERPLRGIRNKGILTATLVGLAVLVAGAGISIVASRGYPARFPPMPEGLIPEDARFPPEWRFGRCLLVSSQWPKDFKAECFGQGQSDGRTRQRVLLWGDSYAGHLYPGLMKRMEAEGKELIQLTAVGCPPLLGYTTPRYPHCSDVGAFVLQWVRTHPEVSVILAANWVGVLKGDRYPMLDDTVAALQASGARGITLYGPPPLWKKPLPTLVLEAQRQEPTSGIASRLGPESQVLSSFLMETWLKRYALEHNIHFVSILDSLCIKQHCLVKAGHRLTSMDHGHLTVEGSDALFQGLPDALGTKD